MNMLASINVSWEPDMHHMRYHLVDGSFICHVPTKWSRFQMDEILTKYCIPLSKVPSSVPRTDTSTLRSI